jgi:prolyl 4-hydroxylase
MHGRPFPLNGSFYANVFIHYIPVDHDAMNEMEFSPHKNEKHVAGHEGDNHVDRDVKEDEEDTVPDEIETRDDAGATIGQTSLHIAAAEGDLDEVRNILNSGKIDVNSVDENGWQPLHEAVHSGHLGIVQLLVKHGADVKHRTHGGGTALWWAKGSLDEGHPVVTFLESIGAPFDEE